MKFVLVVLLATGLMVEAVPRFHDAPDWMNPVRSAEEDEIKNLPGLKDQVDFRQFSGYVKSYVGGDFGPSPRFTHYWFIESNSSYKAPLVVWLNGHGPGESAYLGAFLENGPFEVANPEGTALKLRQHTWSKVANLLYLDTPESVGFSYTRGRPDWFSDRHSVYQQMMSLREFFNKFPNHRTSPLFLAGQGYGGALTASLAASFAAIFDNLRGVLVGNGYLHPDLLTKASLDFAHTRGLLDEATWAQARQECCGGEVPGADSCDKEIRSKPCQTLMRGIYADLYRKGVNPYNVAQNSSAPSSARIEDRFAPLTVYLNQDGVRAALHVPEEVTSWVPIRQLAHYWSDTVDETDEGLLVEFKQLEWVAPVLVYNGDSDMVCSALGTEWFVNKLGRRVKSDWAPWKVDNKVAGYVKEFERGLSLVTVSGAGHEVPSDKPREALALVKSFLDKYTGFNPGS